MPGDPITMNLVHQVRESARKSMLAVGSPWYIPNIENVDLLPWMQQVGLESLKAARRSGSLKAAAHVLPEQAKVCRVAYSPNAPPCFLIAAARSCT
jgi:hypothetical protein